MQTVHPCARIINHAGGMGIVSLQDVEKRAVELAEIDGRSLEDASDLYWEQARYELHGGHDTSNDLQEESGVSVGPDMVASSFGHHVVNQPSDESEFAVQELIQEGMEEAEHEQMLAASRNREPDED